MFTLMMPEAEIISSYEDAKNPSKQIRVLADLNCTTAKAMREWLISKGCQVPEDKRFKDKEAKVLAEVKEETSPEAVVTLYNNDGSVAEQIPKKGTGKIEVPESIRRILNERRRHLIEQIKKLQSEVNDINGFIGDYRKE